MNQEQIKRVIVGILLSAVTTTIAQETNEVAQVEEADVRVAQLEQELKAAKVQINDLEEQLYFATDGESHEDELVEELEEGAYPWTYYMRRLPVGVIMPHTGTVPKGEFFGRFSHIAREQSFTADGADWWADMLGLENQVKIGIMFGYGLTDKWDITFQRTNGREVESRSNPNDDESTSYDLWDVLTKYRVLDEFEQGVDLAVLLGATYFWTHDYGEFSSNDEGDIAFNAAILIEKSLWRFRFGTGLMYSSLSDYQDVEEAAIDTAPDKIHPDQDPEGEPRPNWHTLAVPVSAAFSVFDKTSIFGEMAFPVGGYDTDFGPSAAAGVRINTATHSYSMFFSNTPNNSYNSTFTGGYAKERLDLFGFDITIFF